MKYTFTEKTKLPGFIFILFWLQFLVFLVYSYKQNEYSVPLITFIIILGLLLHLIVFKLKISNTHIMYSIAPFVSKKVEWRNIAGYEVIKISAINDFGGWGIRHSSKYGNAYILGGDYAIALKGHKGGKVTLSVKDREGLESFLSEKNLTNKQVLTSDNK